MDRLAFVPLIRARRMGSSLIYFNELLSSFYYISGLVANDANDKKNISAWTLYGAVEVEHNRDPSISLIVLMCALVFIVPYEHPELVTETARVENAYEQ